MYVYYISASRQLIHQQKWQNVNHYRARLKSYRENQIDMKGAAAPATCVIKSPAKMVHNFCFIPVCEVSNFKCSMFTGKSIYYRLINGYSSEDV